MSERGVEDGMGFSGLVSSKAEREEAKRDAYTSARLKAQADRIKELEAEIAETNAAFSEAVHMHQQTRAALAALLEKVEAREQRAAELLKRAEDNVANAELSDEITAFFEECKP
jgi:hypothetical protein